MSTKRVEYTIVSCDTEGCDEQFQTPNMYAGFAREAARKAGWATEQKVVDDPGWPNGVVRFIDICPKCAPPLTNEVFDGFVGAVLGPVNCPHCGHPKNSAACQTQHP